MPRNTSELPGRRTAGGHTAPECYGQPPNRRRLPSNRRRLPPNRRRLPPNRRRLPPNRRRLPTNRHRLPTNRRRLPSNRRRLPPNRRRLPPNRRRLPPNRRRLPPNRRRLPSNRRRLPPNRRRLPPNRRRLPPNRGPQPPSVTPQPPLVTLEPPSVTLPPPFTRVRGRAPILRGQTHARAYVRHWRLPGGQSARHRRVTAMRVSPGPRHFVVCGVRGSPANRRRHDVAGPHNAPSAQLRRGGAPGEATGAHPSTIPLPHRPPALGQRWPRCPPLCVRQCDGLGLHLLPRVCRVNGQSPVLGAGGLGLLIPRGRQ